MIISKRYQKAAREALRKGELVVMPSDTIYGIFADARNKRAVEKLYAVRKRNPAKPVLILAGRKADASVFFKKKPSKQEERILSTVWPGPVTVVLGNPEPRYRYLHRGSGGLAVRIPASPTLRAFLRKTGPLAAPSANREGEVPAEEITDAIRTFGEAVAVYGDGGKRKSKPSTIIRITDAGCEILREGQGKIPRSLRSRYTGRNGYPGSREKMERKNRHR